MVNLNLIISVVIQGTGLSKLESLLKAAVTEFNLGEERLKKAENFARRAPMVICGDC